MYNIVGIRVLGIKISAVEMERSQNNRQARFTNILNIQFELGVTLLSRDILKEGYYKLRLLHRTIDIVRGYKPVMVMTTGYSSYFRPWVHLVSFV